MLVGPRGGGGALRVGDETVAVELSIVSLPSAGALQQQCISTLFGREDPCEG